MLAPRSPEDALPISLVAHHVFCPRRAWLEAVGERTDTEQMTVGELTHSAVDDRAASRGVRFTRIEVASDTLGIVGRCDAVEVNEDGTLQIVEHKATPVRREATVTEPMRIQLALQAMALEEMGHDVAGTAVWFATHRRRVDVDLQEEDRSAARTAIQETRAVVTSESAPAPLEDDPRCAGCSHAGVCLPDERRPSQAIPPRVLAADPVGQTLHLTTPGARASLRSGRVEVRHRGERQASIPLERVAALMVHGNVDVSGALIRELLYRRVPVLWATGGGRLVGHAQSADGPNGGVRHRQHLAAQAGHLDLPAAQISAKIANQATLLRRLGTAPLAVRRLRVLQGRAGTAVSASTLLGIEGEAASLYFASFETMLTPATRERVEPRFVGRSGRSAYDPVNALLNYTYMLLLADVVKAVVACGLDPSAGFLHTATRNKPALALDLMEEFRAPVADSVVIGALNNGEVRAEDFSTALGTCRMRDRARRQVVHAYERRMQTEFVHPLFRYRVTWRRAVEVQARQVLGLIDGSQPRYGAIRVR